MLNIAKEQKGQELSIRLSGQIEENVDFEKLIGPPAAVMRVNCKEVKRINSVGVKQWIRYFHAAGTNHAKLIFQECSTAIVEQINLISNFTCGGTVESIYVPFICTGCQSELVGLFTTEDLKKMKLQLPELTCSKCGKNAIFDDIPEEYFGFLVR